MYGMLYRLLCCAIELPLPPLSSSSHRCSVATAVADCAAGAAATTTTFWHFRVFCASHFYFHFQLDMIWFCNWSIQQEEKSRYWYTCNLRAILPIAHSIQKQIVCIVILRNDVSMLMMNIRESRSGIRTSYHTNSRASASKSQNSSVQRYLCSLRCCHWNAIHHRNWLEFKSQFQKQFRALNFMAGSFRLLFGITVDYTLCVR